jgi:hypothetical protein
MNVEIGAEAAQLPKLVLGLATEFCSEKIPRNRLRLDSIIPRKKLIIAREFQGLRKSHSEAQNGTELHGKKTKQPK